MIQEATFIRLDELWIGDVLVLFPEGAEETVVRVFKISGRVEVTLRAADGGVSLRNGKEDALCWIRHRPPATQDSVLVPVVEILKGDLLVPQSGADEVVCFLRHAPGADGKDFEVGTHVGYILVRRYRGNDMCRIRLRPPSPLVSSRFEREVL